MVSRRSLLAALPATTLAAVPIHALENPADRVCRLLDELSHALSEYCDGSFRAIVDPSNLPNGSYWLRSANMPTTADPESILPDNLTGLQKAIVRHRSAWEALEASCGAADDLSGEFDPVNGPATWNRLNRLEERAKSALLRLPVATAQGQRAKAAYLRECCHASRAPLLEQDLSDLIAAMELA